MRAPLLQLTTAGIAAILTCTGCTDGRQPVFAPPADTMPEWGAPNAPAYVYEIDPHFFVAGTQDTFVSIRGMNFSPATQVFVDGAVQGFTAINAGVLRVPLPASVLAEPRDIELRVLNPGADATNGSTRLITVYEPVVVDAAGHERLGNACIIDQAGALVCWEPAPRRFAGHLRFDALYPGSSQGNVLNCARAISGDLYCWGSNSSGQLGTGDRVHEWEPSRPVVGGHRFVTVAVGWTHACGIDEEGLAWCWGSNASGQLGTERADLEICSFSAECATSPVPVGGGLRFRSLGAGFRHTCAITVDGASYCWGTAEYFALGALPAENSRLPRPTASGLEFVAVHSGGNSNCALTADGAAHCWGGNSAGQLGVGAPGHVETPYPMAGGVRFDRLALGPEHGCGVARDGAAYCWGAGGGRLGVGLPARGSHEPLRVVGDYRWTDVRPISAYSSCGLALPGGFYCWGQTNVSVAIAVTAFPVLCREFRPGQGEYCHAEPAPVLGTR